MAPGTNTVKILGPNRYAMLPVRFNDFNASFNGAVLATDIADNYVYLDVTGTANNNFNSGTWLDVYLTQSYITRPGLWGFFGVEYWLSPRTRHFGRIKRYECR